MLHTVLLSAFCSDTLNSLHLCAATTVDGRKALFARHFYGGDDEFELGLEDLKR